MRIHAALAAFILLVALMTGTLLSTAFAQPTPTPDPVRDAHALFGELWEWNLREYPEIATYVGDPRYRDRLADQSAEAVERRKTQRERFLERALAIDAGALAPEDRVSLRVLRYQLEQAVALGRLCAPLSCNQGEFWSPVTQFGGVHLELPRLVDATTFGSVRDYEAYIARLQAVPALVDQLIARMELGMKLGWMPAKIAVARVPSQLDA